MSAFGAPAKAQAACSVPTTALTFGAAPTTGTIGAAAETDCFTFSGAVGDVIRIRVVETSGALLASVRVMRPPTFTTQVCAPTVAQNSNCTLDTPGTHRIELTDNSATNTGNYSIAIQRLNNPSSCPAISFGAAPTVGNMAAAAEMDCFTFTGAVGGQIRLRHANTGGTLFSNAEIIRPNGTTICGPSGSLDIQCGPLNVAGSYRIIIEDSAGSNTGGYALAVQRMNSPPAGTCTALTFGALVTGSIGANAEMDCFSFSAGLGNRIRIRLVETSGTLFASQEVFRPNGTTICGQSFAIDVTCTLDTTGTQRILVADSSGTKTGNYSLVVQRLNNPTACATILAFGAAPTAAGIGAAGEMDCYTFAGAAGDMIRSRHVNTSGSLFSLVEVIRPNGTTICGQNGALDVNCQLDTTGTYRILVVDSAGTNTGNYTLAIQRLNNPPAATCPALTFGAAPTATSIGANGEIDCFRFSGAIGGQIRIRLVETSGTLFASQEVIRPNGSTNCGQSFAVDVTCTLDVTGVHRILVVDSSGTKTGNYSISIQRLNAPVGCTTLTFGDPPTNRTLTPAGKTDCFSFAAVAGDVIRVRHANVSGSLFNLAEVIRPDGTTMCGQNGSLDFNCTLDTNGTYRILIVDSAGTNTGDYTLAIQRLNAPVGCTALTFGAAPTARTISANGEVDCFTLPSAPIGSRIRVRLVETSGTLFASQEIIRPSGSTNCGQSFSVDVTCVLDVTGVHPILVTDSNGLKTGNYSISVQRLNAPTGCTALTFGAAPTAAGFAAPGEMDCYTFTGAAGDVIRLRMVNTSGTSVATAEFLRPNGATICGPSGSLDQNCTLSGAGTAFKLIVEDSAGTNTGTYTLALQKLNAPTGCTALTFGAAPTNASISGNGEVDCFTVNKAVPDLVPGDVLRVRVVETSGTLFAMQEVARPEGTPTPGCTQTFAVDLTCVVDSTGTHRILVGDSNGLKTGTYRIAVQLLNAPVGCAAIAFGAAAPATGSIGVAGETDCRTVTGAPGDVVRIRQLATSGVGFSPGVEVVRPNGTTVCGLTGALDSTCVLDDSGTHTILIRDTSPANTGNYAIKIQRMNNPVGCSTVTVGGGVVAGNIGANGDFDCFRFAATAGTTVTTHVNETGGTLLAIQDVSRPNGTFVCGPTSAVDMACGIDADGNWVLVVGDNTGLKTGTYGVNAT